mmetsp:Transcript_21585/g.30231  ORF Transcript_21585/g.30231 Transcript_21585/m.30231 type:complete len:216 (+) Transcript_21585:2425-3072(+)
MTNTPAEANLYEIDLESEALMKKESDLFHLLVAKLLFLCKRLRPDIYTTVAFLTTRLKSPALEDENKLHQVIKYLCKNKGLVLTLKIDQLQIVKWWVDASFGIHSDYKSQTGAHTSLGKGCFYSTSEKHKVNSRSSTEAELIGVSNRMPMVLWTRLFMEAQGITIKDNIVYQDNTSTKLIAKHGKLSCEKKTRYMNIKYFFITDQIQQGKINIHH